MASLFLTLFLNNSTPREVDIFPLHPVQQEVKALKAPTLQNVTAIAASTIVKTEPAPVASSGSDIELIVRQAARAHGIDENHFVAIARCESGLHPNAINHGYFENGYPSGLFQHLSGYWPARAAKYGYAGASVFDAVANANVTAAMFAEGDSGLWQCK